MGQPTVQQLVDILGLQPHPEGGFFRETYRSKTILPGGLLPGVDRNRTAGTAILFLLPEGSCSLLHRLRADEMWHFYLGGPLILVELSGPGETLKTVLGAKVLAGERVQHVVPAGRWFGAYPRIGSSFSLVGCTVGPGFEFEDLEFGKREDLLASFPGAEEEIMRLTD